MSQGGHEDFIVHAAVENLSGFERDTTALGEALEALYAKLRKSIASNLGADEIARMREEIAGLNALIATQQRESASARAVKAQAKFDKDPTDANAAANKAADLAAQRAEKDLRTATAGLATARNKRIDEETKVAQEADREMLEGARTMRQRASDLLTKGRQAIAGSKSTDIDAELRREEAAQKRAADKAIADKAKADKQALIDKEKADKEALEQAKRDRNKLSPQQIAGLTSRADLQLDPSSSAGRVSLRQAQQRIELDKADAALLEAKQRALTGVVPEAEMALQLRSLAEARLRASQALLQTTDLLGKALKQEADEAAATAATQNLSFLGKQRSNFMIGFKGASDVPYMQQAGQAAKFSLLYGTAYKALFAVTQTFQMALQEGIAFQQGLSDMAIATGRPKEELGTLAERLAQISAAAGGSPAAGVEIGARAQGLYGLSGSKDTAQQNYVAELSTRIVSRMAMGTKVDPVTLQQNIAAITQALGLGAGGQVRVADLDQYFAKRFGSGVGDTLEAGAQSGSVGIAAGFSLEQIQGLAALMIGRTGQSSNAVGGYLAQIFSRGGEGSLQNVASKYGVDTQQSLAKQFADLSKVYNASDPQQQSEISAAFGRGKVQNAVVAALQSWGDVAAEAKKAQDGKADGALDTAFTERIGNLGGQINLLVGDLKQFAHLFGESGLLTVLGAGIEVLDLTVKALNDILSLYNELNPALKALIGTVVATTLLGKITGGGGAGLAGRFGLGARLGGAGEAAAAETAVAKETATTSRLMSGRFGGAVKSFSDGATKIGKTGGAIVGALDPAMLAAVAGLWAISAVQQSAKELKDAQEQATQALRQSPDATASSGDLRNFASVLSDQGRQLSDSASPFKALWFGEDLNAAADAQLKEAKRLKAAADELDSAAAPKQPLFSHWDTDSMNASLDAISAGGGEATQRLRALARAIDELASASKRKTPQLINPETLSGYLVKAALDLGDVKLDTPGSRGLYGFLKGDKTIHIGPVPFNTNLGLGHQPSTMEFLAGDTGKRAGDRFDPEIRRQLPGTEIRDRLMSALSLRGISSYEELTADQAEDISKEVGKLTKTDAMGSVENFTALQKEVDKKIYDALMAQRKKILNLPGAKGSLNRREAKANSEKVNAEADARLDTIPDTDYTSKIKAAQLALDKLRKARRFTTDKNAPAVWKGLSDARSRLASAQIDQLEALRKVAEQNASSQREASNVGMGFVRKEIDAAVNARSATQLSRVIAGAGKGAVAIARKAIRDAQQVAATGYTLDRYYKEQLPKFKSTKDTIDDYISSLDKPGADDKPPTLGELLDPSKRPDHRKKKKPKDGPGVFRQLLEALDTTVSDGSDSDTAVQIRAARISAQMAKKGGDIASARAAIAQASADLSDAEEGTVAYYNALASMYQARQQLSDALAAYRKNIRTLHIDITDPVAQAQLELQEARRKLRRDAGRGRDVKAQDRVDIRQSQVSLESEKFNQRLSDVQTAEQLGRISHSAYMRYLQHEHDRLSSIGKRTRQQQDELNQIDSLMLEAKKSMDQAWNIGDIKLPTPYEVRKYVKEQAGLGQNDRVVQHATTQVYIDGADVGMVKRVISQTVGKSAQVMTVSPRRT